MSLLQGMEQHTLKNVNICKNTKILLLISDIWWLKFKYIFNFHLFFDTRVFRHLWQPKTAVFLHRCLLHSVLLNKTVCALTSHSNFFKYLIFFLFFQLVHNPGSPPSAIKASFNFQKIFWLKKSIFGNKKLKPGSFSWISISCLKL